MGHESCTKMDTASIAKSMTFDLLRCLSLRKDCQAAFWFSVTQLAVVQDKSEVCLLSSSFPHEPFLEPLSRSEVSPINKLLHTRARLPQDRHEGEVLWGKQNDSRRQAPEGQLEQRSILSKFLNECARILGIFRLEFCFGTVCSKKQRMLPTPDCISYVICTF